MEIAGPPQQSLRSAERSAVKLQGVLPPVLRLVPCSQIHSFGIAALIGHLLPYMLKVEQMLKSSSLVG